MADTHQTYELRCPVHGFIPINDWERDIINQPAFQRLRRIRQLAWTDQVYPGAMHTHFEHSLGVMHLATKLYDCIVGRSRQLLADYYGYDDAGFRRDRALVRLAALLHDVGHSPFSHAGEDVFPHRPNSTKRYVHEEYSASIIRHLLNDTIENHPLNGNYDFKADDVAALIEGSSKSARRVFSRDIISGQMDADRMDYLLRDSLHAGVDYGKYDWRRLLNTAVAVEMLQPEGETQRQGLPSRGKRRGHPRCRGAHSCSLLHVHPGLLPQDAGSPSESCRTEERNPMTLSRSQTRTAILARMVSNAPDQKLGRTQLMKLYYFLQELHGHPLGYDFRLFSYGPFDSEVLSDLATATSLNTVCEKTVIYPRGYGYAITPGPHADRLSRELETNDPALAAKVDAVVREFATFGAAELELRSTILFVDRELSEADSSTTAAELTERVRLIKPYFSETMILTRVEEMERKGWLKSIAATTGATRSTA